MEENTIKKIVIIGPESTGKSTLCQQLANHYNTLWCAEFAREYLLSNGTNYSFEDLKTIATGQLDLEDKMTQLVKQNFVNSSGLNNNKTKNQHASPILFIDTDMYVMKVWCEYVFGKCHNFILNEIVTRQYDLYLLCNIDLPWVQDVLREYPDEKPRQELYKIYKDLLINQTTAWVEISGSNEERLAAAIKAVDEFFSLNV